MGWIRRTPYYRIGHDELYIDANEQLASRRIGRGPLTGIGWLFVVVVAGGLGWVGWLAWQALWNWRT